MPSRPIANKMRDTDACEVMAEPSAPATYAAVKKVFRNWPPAVVMTSSEPAYAVAAAIWIDGKPMRPGLAMRLRMALDSLTGSDHAPMVVTVTPVVNWDSRDPLELSAAGDALTRFLQTHPELDETVGKLSALH